MNYTHILNLDIETFSSTDLTKSGVYRYAEAPDFDILMCAYSLDGGEVEIIDLTENPSVGKAFLTSLILDENVLKVAWNAAFERICFSRWLGLPTGKYLSPNSWLCTMSQAAMCGLPLSLDAAAKALRLDAQKDTKGKALIRYFSVPCKPTKANGERLRNLPEHAAVDWQAFKDYCKQDVVTEMAIGEALRPYAHVINNNKERAIWLLDQRINDYGVKLEKRLAENAVAIDAEHREKLLARAAELTGLDNPNSAAQIRRWLEDETGEEVATLRKSDIPVLLQSVDSKVAKEVLKLRQLLSKTSVKKYTAMLNSVCSDGRIRGLLQYYGASRTGRWAGRLVQVQNLPRNSMKTLEQARATVINGDCGVLEWLYDNVPDTLSQLLRTAFTADEGKVLMPSDFSAIEARVLAWLAGEKWRIDVFNTHGKIYEASAAAMFGVPLEKIKKGNPEYELRAKGKVAELALGYQGGANALLAMEIGYGVPEESRMPEEDKVKLVKLWRKANPKIVQFWYDVQQAAVNAIQNPTDIFNVRSGLIKFVYKNDALQVTLPSGRTLLYLGAKLAEGQYGYQVKYLGSDGVTKKWGYITTYGGKLTENIVQAVARDCLADSLLALDVAGYNIAMHVHDEVVVEGLEADLERISQIMSTPLAWAKGLPLKAEAYATPYYRKDD